MSVFVDLRVRLEDGGREKTSAYTGCVDKSENSRTRRVFGTQILKHVVYFF